MLIGVGVSCCISYSIVSYLYVSFSGLITSVREERAIFSAIIVVSVWRDYLFLFVLGIGCIILLWHSLGLQYNNLEVVSFDKDPGCHYVNMLM